MLLQVTTYFLLFLFLLTFLGLSIAAFGAFLHPKQLVRPEAFEGFRPLMQGTNRFGIGLIQHVSPMALHPNQPYISQYPQMLGDRRLLHSGASHNFLYRSLFEG